MECVAQLFPFSPTASALAAEVVAACRRGRVRVATAESCTGGLVGAVLTSVPGASAVFNGGTVCYQNRLKASLLGVRWETLERVGAVSAECARQMAEGAQSVEMVLQMALECLRKREAKMVNIDWSKLGFAYMPTRSHIRYTWKDGAWDKGVLVNEPTITMSVAAGCLHYGQEAFEGLKVFRQKDGRVVAFRPDMNAERLQRTARKTVMPPVSTEMFLEALERVVRDNIDYVPPYGTGCAMYVRPLLIGTGPQIGVAPAHEYTFLVMVMPMGDYYKGGIKPVKAVIFDEYDRAAPQGMGDVKVGGNYAASLYAHERAHGMGFPVELYLDAKTHTNVEEFATSNFLGFKKDGTFVTVRSDSVLPSVTNLSLQQLAKDMGHKVEVRTVPYAELADFAEIGACGTAVVVTPVCEIHRGEEVIKVGSPDVCGPNLLKLHDAVQDIQFGRVPDPYGWCYAIQ